MDPQACLALVVSAIEDHDLEAADEHYGNLRAWVGRGGFKPKISDRDFDLIRDYYDDILQYADLIDTVGASHG